MRLRTCTCAIMYLYAYMGLDNARVQLVPACTQARTYIRTEKQACTYLKRASPHHTTSLKHSFGVVYTEDFGSTLPKYTICLAGFLETMVFVLCILWKITYTSHRKFRLGHIFSFDTLTIPSFCFAK